MYKLIICEGKTDAILLSYYLRKVSGWTHCKKDDDLPYMSLESQNEFIWYSKGEEYLAIWSVGGVSNFHKASENLKAYNKVADMDRIYSRIIYLSDRDNNTVESVINRILTDFPEITSSTPLNNQFHPVEHLNRFNQTINYEIGFIIIPFDEEGAMETFLLNCFSNKSEELNCIVYSVGNLIDDTLSEISYLIRTRNKVKSKLGVTLAIISPEKVFTNLNEMLIEIDWENYESFQEGFTLLKDI